MEKSQYFKENKQISGFPGEARKQIYTWGKITIQQIFQCSETILYDTVIVDTWHCTFVRKYRKIQQKSKSQSMQIFKNHLES